MTGECGATTIVGGTPHRCVRQTWNHAGRQHIDPSGFEWPPCSQHCAVNHEHGRYRARMGIALGPKTPAARAPGRDKAARAAARHCRACMTPEELDADGNSNLRHGRCSDRQACLERQPQLDLGIAPDVPQSNVASL